MRDLLKNGIWINLKTPALIIIRSANEAQWANGDPHNYYSDYIVTQGYMMLISHG